MDLEEATEEYERSSDGSAEDRLIRLAQRRVGTTLRDKYRLDAVLGVGGMAAVYKATHRNDAELAIKILHSELSAHEEIKSRFLREGKAANSVKHPGVVAIVDDDLTEDGAAFLVMELLHGATVSSLWDAAGQRFPVPSLLSVASQLLDILAAAHAKGTIHRDIKPANLFVTADGTLKVLDFGIARVKKAVATHSSVRTTASGVTLGTPAFMAPEQARGAPEEIDAKTDIWSVGATLFTLLTGESVHAEGSAAQIMMRAAALPPRGVSSVILNAPPPVARAIDRALAFEKSQRWASAAVMRDAIEQASVEVLGGPTSKTTLVRMVARDLARQNRDRQSRIGERTTAKNDVSAFAGSDTELDASQGRREAAVGSPRDGTPASLRDPAPTPPSPSNRPSRISASAPTFRTQGTPRVVLGLAVIGAALACLLLYGAFHLREGGRTPRSAPAEKLTRP